MNVKTCILWRQWLEPTTASDASDMARLDRTKVAKVYQMCSDDEFMVCNDCQVGHAFAHWVNWTGNIPN